MFIDQITLAEGAVLENLTVASGTLFPPHANSGELFFRTDIDGGVLYIYAGGQWLKSANISNVTAASIGLGNVNNTSDNAKPVSAAQLAALNLKANISSLAQVATTGNYSDLINKPSVATFGLDNVDNTSDLNKPVSNAQQAALNFKADISSLATVATSGSYNDLSNKPATVTLISLGLNNVNNTSDANKPVSNAQQAALNLKANISSLATVATSGSYLDLTNTPVFNASSLGLHAVATSGDYTDLSNKPASPTKTSIGLGNVDNTSDISKPISTATQDALDLKANITDLVALGLLYTVKTVNGDYSIIQSDVTLNTMIRVVSPVSTTAHVTLPTDAQVDCPIGTTVVVSSGGYGLVTINAAAGASVYSPQSLSIDRKYGRILAVKVANNTWEVDGQLVEQAQFVVFNISPVGTTHYLYDSFTPPQSSEIIENTITINGNSISPQSYNIDRATIYPTSHAWGAQLSNASDIFANNLPIGKYFKAEVSSGTASLLSYAPNPYDGLNYYGSGVYAQYNTGANTLNPKWKFQQTVGTLTPITLLITVSETPNDSNIIGTFTQTINPIQESNIIEDFASNVPLNFGVTGGFKVTVDGIMDVTNNLNLATWSTFGAQYTNDHLGYVVTEIGSSGNYDTNGGELGIVYLFDVSPIFAPTSGYTGSLTLQVEIMSDAEGSYQPITVGTFVFDESN